MKIFEHISLLAKGHIFRVFRLGVIVRWYKLWVAIEWGPGQVVFDSQPFWKNPTFFPDWYKNL